MRSQPRGVLAVRPHAWLTSGDEVLVRATSAPAWRTSADGYGTTFAVNVLAPHLRTHRLSAELQGRLLWLGSGLAGSARSRPAALGRQADPRRAYAESKACDVGLGLGLAWES